MRIQEIILESQTATADEIWRYVQQLHPTDQQGGGYLERLVQQYPRYKLRTVPLASLHIPDQEYDDEEQDIADDPYNRTLTVDPDHAGKYSQHHVDRSPIVVDANGYILDGNHRAWAAAELLGRDTIRAWVPVKSVTEDAFNGINVSLEIQKDDEYVDDEDYDNQVIYVTASSNGRELGHVLFAFDGEYLMPQDLEVDERYRGQGIAATMYDYVTSQGYKIRRSGQQTPAGAGFWDRHCPEKNLWEQQELDEIGDTRTEYEPNRRRKRSLFHATVDGRWVDVFFDRSFTGSLQITFTVNQNYEPSQHRKIDQGTVFRIFSAVQQIIKERLPEYMRTARPPRVTFTAKGDSRVKLYRRMFVPVISEILGPKWQLAEHPGDLHLFLWEPVRKQKDVAEGGAETSWSNDTDTITLQDILELTKHIKQINLPINDSLKSKLLHWEGNPEEIERVNQVTVSNQFPILIMVDEQGQIAWILDGNHRLHKAIQSQAKTIPAKLIRPNNLNDKAKKIFNIKEQGVAEGKVKLYTDPSYFGAEIDDTGFDSLPVVNISADRLVGFEPDDKMNQPKSKANVEKIVAGLKQGAKLPPLLVRKYKDGYQVLDGHHRFWAYKLSGTKSIPSRIVPDKDIEEISKQSVAESVNDYLWHGSRYRNEVLVPRQANDTGGKEESNKNAIYATPSAKVAIAMGLTTPGSDTGMFPNDPQMVLFKGGIRKGEMVYLHKVPKDLFIKHNSREWYSKPDVKEITPIEVITVPVDKWLSLIRTATPKDLELQKKYMKKQGVAEGVEQNPDQVRQTLNAWMNQDQQFKEPPQRAGFQAKVWPYIEQNIKTILADRGEDGKGSYPAAPYAAWLLVQHMDAYPQNQGKFLQQLAQSGLDPTDGKDGVGKLQFLKDRYEVNKWILQNANNKEYWINGKPLPNPTVNVRNPAMFKDAGQVATSREDALKNAIEAGNKLLVAAVQAPPAKLTQPSYKSNVAEGKIKR